MDWIAYTIIALFIYVVACLGEAAMVAIGSLFWAFTNTGVKVPGCSWWNFLRYM